MVVLRAEDASEFRKFCELLVEYERSLPMDLRHGLESDATFVSTAYARPNAAFTALIGEAVAGCVAVTRHDDSTAIVQRLYVRPAYRKHGVGRALMAAVVDFCRDHGYGRVALDTERRQLPAAYRLYASLGFTDCEAYGSVTYANPTFMELHLM